MTDSDDFDKETLGRMVRIKHMPFFFSTRNVISLQKSYPGRSLQEYEDIFAFFDLDVKGSIDMDEFEQVFSRSIGFTGS